MPPLCRLAATLGFSTTITLLMAAYVVSVKPLPGYANLNLFFFDNHFFLIHSCPIMNYEFLHATHRSPQSTLDTCSGYMSGECAPCGLVGGFCAWPFMYQFPPSHHGPSSPFLSHPPPCPHPAPPNYNHTSHPTYLLTSYVHPLQTELASVSSTLRDGGGLSCSATLYPSPRWQSEEDMLACFLWR